MDAASPDCSTYRGGSGGGTLRGPEGARRPQTRPGQHGVLSRQSAGEGDAAAVDVGEGGGGGEGEEEARGGDGNDSAAQLLFGLSTSDFASFPLADARFRQDRCSECKVVQRKVRSRGPMFECISKASVWE